MCKPTSEAAGARRGDVGCCGIREQAATNADGNCCDGRASIQMWVLQDRFRSKYLMENYYQWVVIATIRHADEASGIDEMICSMPLV
jgi:hypothetical protein